MDESLTHFQAEQKRLASGRGPIVVLKRQIKARLIGLGMFAAIIWGLAAGLGTLPRNADNSIKLIYFGPALALLAAIAVLFLRHEPSKRSPFRLTAWSLIALALVAIPAGVIDFATRNGS